MKATRLLHQSKALARAGKHQEGKTLFFRVQALGSGPGPQGFTLLMGTVPIQSDAAQKHEEITMPTSATRLLTAALFAPLFALTVSVPTAMTAETGTNTSNILYVYTWTDYFSQEAIRLFEENNNCQVEFYYYDSNETMQQSLAEAGGYDVMTPASNTAADLYAEGALLPLNHTLIPNIENIDRSTPALLQDKEMRYSIPYTVTVTGIGYNKNAVPADALDGWNIFGSPELAGRMTMLNDMREVLGAGLKHLGYGINSTNEHEIFEAARVVLQWKKNLAKFDVDGAKDGLRDGLYDVIQTYNGDMALLIAQSPSLAFYVPDEGSALNTDEFVIDADCQNPVLAHAFINHFLDPEIAAMNMESTFYFMPNPKALKKLSKSIRTNPAFNVSAQAIAKSEMIRNLGEQRTLYDEAWEKVLLGD